MENKEELVLYIKKYKEHEARRASTDERNAYWQSHQERKCYVPQSHARFEHG
jgi:hypothetical protein